MMASDPYSEAAATKCCFILHGRDRGESAIKWKAGKMVLVIAGSARTEMVQAALSTYLDGMFGMEHGRLRVTSTSVAACEVPCFAIAPSEKLAKSATDDPSRKTAISANRVLVRVVASAPEA